MTNDTKSIAANYEIPAYARVLLGKPPLVFGEDPERYEQLLQSSAAAMKPEDAAGWLAVGRFVTQNWVAERMRGYEAKYLNYKFREAMAGFLVEASTEVDNKKKHAGARQLALNAARGEPTALAKQKSDLARVGYDEEDAHALAFSRSIPQLQSTAIMIAASELAIERAVEQFENWNASRRHSHDIQDAEYAELPPGEPPSVPELPNISVPLEPDVDEKA